MQEQYTSSEFVCNRLDLFNVWCTLTVEFHLSTVNIRISLNFFANTFVIVCPGLNFYSLALDRRFHKLDCLQAHVLLYLNQKYEPEKCAASNTIIPVENIAQCITFV